MKYDVDIIVTHLAQKISKELQEGQFILLKNVQTVCVGTENSEFSSQLSDSSQQLLDFCLMEPDGDFVVLPENHHEARNIRRRIAKLQKEGESDEVQKDDSVDMKLMDLQLFNNRLEPLQRKQTAANVSSDQRAVRNAEVQEQYKYVDSKSGQTERHRGEKLRSDGGLLMETAGAEKDTFGKTQTVRKQCQRIEGKENISQQAITALPDDKKGNGSINLRNLGKRLLGETSVESENADAGIKLAKMGRSPKAGNKDPSPKLPSVEDSWDRVMRQVPSDVQNTDGIKVLPSQRQRHDFKSASGKTENTSNGSIKPYQNVPQRNVMECVDRENARLEVLSDELATFDSHEAYRHCKQDNFNDVKCSGGAQAEAEEVNCFQVSDINITTSLKSDGGRNNAVYTRASSAGIRTVAAVTSTQVDKSQGAVKETFSARTPNVIHNETYTFSPNEEEGGIDNLGSDEQKVGNSDHFPVHPTYSANREVLNIYHSDSETSDRVEKKGQASVPCSKQLKCKDICKKKGNNFDDDNGSRNVSDYSESLKVPQSEDLYSSENNYSKKKEKVNGVNEKKQAAKSGRLTKQRQSPAGRKVSKVSQVDCDEGKSEANTEKQENSSASSSTHFSGATRHSGESASGSSNCTSGSNVIQTNDDRETSVCCASVTEDSGAAPVSIAHIKNHQISSKFRLRVKVISIEPSVQSVSKDVTLLLAGLCNICHWLFDFADLRQGRTYEEKSKHRYLCPRCSTGDALVRLTFLFHLHVHDEVGDCILMYVCGSSAEAFLSCRPEEFLDTAKQQNQILAALASLQRGNFMDITVMVNDFGDGLEYQLYDTKLVT